ncbi:guanine deaminase [Marimonas lutisalis]|uniref:guanine deaminase n=1 Tax=Marimonas lutisalis TaxID=2545756 RepID=UPI0010F9954F|nr:guanine deaminase [Marimonas lutisalis]
MTVKILRSRVLSFDRAPQGPQDGDAFTYIEDGALLLRDGVIAARGAYLDISRQEPAAEIIDHRPHLLMPGFIDPHLHFPQVQVIASWGEQLLDWLSDYTFPEEMRFSDPEHAARMATAFFDLLTAHGTTTAVAYCSAHKTSAEAFFTEAARRNMCMAGGKVMMDRNAPDGLVDEAQSSHDDSAALIEAWHGKGRLRYAITPRFAITSSPAQLEAAGALAQAHPDCFVQTHLSENKNEIAETLRLFPDAPDYIGVYEMHGLLGPKALLGHCIHLESREIDVLAETGSHPVFCPTSNLFLGSGLFDDAGLRARGIGNAIATDIGGGTSYSMLQTLNEGYKVLQLQRQQMHPYTAFHWITRGNAEVMGMADRIGTLDVGSDADIVVLNSAATPAMALRAERIETLAEELFLLMILGDDRAVVQTYVAGVAMKAAG